MNFNQKLNVILEVFDLAFSPDAMDDVVPSVIGDSMHYYFDYVKDRRSYSYVVIISGSEIRSRMNDPNPMQWVIANNVKKLRIPGVLTDKYYEIVLKSDDDFALTGLNNANYVYGKMLACLFDFVKNKGLPALIYFSSYDEKTTVTYQKLLNMVARVKGLKYLPISNTMFILNSVAEQVDASQQIEKAQKQRAEKLQQSKDEKARSRDLQLGKSVAPRETSWTEI